MLALCTADVAERTLDDPSQAEHKLVSKTYTKVVLGQKVMLLTSISLFPQMTLARAGTPQGLAAHQFPRVLSRWTRVKMPGNVRLCGMA
jgi:hypothetical protein